MSCTAAGTHVCSLFNGSTSSFDPKKRIGTAMEGKKQIRVTKMNVDQTVSPTPLVSENLKIDSRSSFGRRNLIGLSSALLISSPEFGQQAWAAPKGFKSFTDSVDNYSFVYPFGWQEVSVKGLDIVFKDVIEPLESVGINIIKTEKMDISEFGSPLEVATTLVEKVLTNPSQKSKVISTKERSADGKNYYTFEFVAESPNYTRHALATVGIAYGKFYTLVTGANERRWSKLEDTLSNVADSFTLL